MGIDLYADIGTPRLSFRRLRLLLERTQLTSEYARDRLGEQVQWSATEHLLAALIDAVQAGNWQFAAANTPKGKQRPERPKPIDRPGQAKRVRNRTSLSDREIARRLVAQQRKARKG